MMLFDVPEEDAFAGFEPRAGVVCRRRPHAAGRRSPRRRRVLSEDARVTKPTQDRSEADPRIAEPAPAASEQLLLDLRPQGDAADPTVTEANALADQLLRSPESWTRGFAMIVGPRGAGKTTLLAARLPQARQVRVEEVAALGRRADADETGATGADAELLRDLEAAATFVFEDVDRALASTAGPELEQGLFHLLNLVNERGARLLATARTTPTRILIALPDLRSRLEAASLAVISDPDDALLLAILLSAFHQRGVKVERAAAAYLAKRMERSYPAAQDLVAELDAAALRLGRPVTTALAGETLGWLPTRY